MTIKTVSISKLGKNYQISPNFKLYEMACKDGSNTVKYSEELMAKLEELRTYIGGTITINSGYRTSSYNKKIGGATYSQHIYGTAADIVVKKDGKVISGKLICCLCQTLGFKGIGYISENATHVDMRASGSYKGDERRGYGGNVGGDFYKYFKISKEQINALRAKTVVTEKPKEVEVEEEMTQEQFNKMMDVYLADLAKKEPNAWSAEARAWAENDANGQALVQGTGSGQAYQMFLTREQMITILHRLVKRWM